MKALSISFSNDKRIWIFIISRELPELAMKTMIQCPQRWFLFFIDSYKLIRVSSHNLIVTLLYFMLTQQY